MNDLILKVKNCQPVTTSLDIAEKFNKQHKDVLKAIRNLESPSGEPDWGRRNFAPSNYKNSQGKLQPMFYVTQEGFTILTMGFTGKEALEWKLKYARAFMSMFEYITNQGNIEWQKIRSAGKLVFKDKADTIKEFVEYATEQGSKSAKMYYVNLGKMQKKALGLVKEVYGNNKMFRDVLSIIELNDAMAGDKVCKNAIIEGMGSELFYKDIYKLAKERVETLADLLKPKEKLENN